MGRAGSFRARWNKGKTKFRRASQTNGGHECSIRSTHIQNQAKLVYSPSISLQALCQITEVPHPPSHHHVPNELLAKAFLPASMCGRTNKTKAENDSIQWKRTIRHARGATQDLGCATIHTKLSSANSLRQVR
eukprot:24211-Amphidinium_carterae.1